MDWFVFIIIFFLSEVFWFRVILNLSFKSLYILSLCNPGISYFLHFQELQSSFLPNIVHNIGNDTSSNQAKYHTKGNGQSIITGLFLDLARIYQEIIFSI